MRVVYLIDSADPHEVEWIASRHVRALREVGAEARVVVAGASRPAEPAAADVVRRLPSLDALGDEARRAGDVVVACGARAADEARRLGLPPVARLCVVHPSLDVANEPDGEAEPSVAETTLWLAASPVLVELLQRGAETRDAEDTAVWAPPATVPCPPREEHSSRLRVLLSPLPAGSPDDPSFLRQALAPLLGETPPIELEELRPAEAGLSLSLATLLERSRGPGLVVGGWQQTLGLDYAALQALACGRAAVLSDSPSYRDLDPRRRASLTVPAGDADALRAAVRRLRDEPGLNARLAAEARRVASSPSLRTSGELLREVLTAARDRRALEEEWRHRAWPSPPSPAPGRQPDGDVEGARRYQWQVEREIADRLRDTTRTQRRQLYSLAYDEFFRRVPRQPQLAQAREPGAQRALVDLQLRLVEPFVTRATVFLEVGAGDCAFAQALASRVRRVHAVEASRTFAPPPSGTEPTGFHFTVADLPPVPVADGSIDVAYSSHVVEHLHPDDLAPHLADVLRTLVPGGLYLCVTPNRLLGPHDVSRYFAERAGGLHLREYTHDELAHALRRAGFAPVRALRRLGRRPPRGWLPVIRVVERLLELLPPVSRRRLLGRIARRPEPFRPLEQVKLVAWRARRDR